MTQLRNQNANSEKMRAMMAEELKNATVARKQAVEKVLALETRVNEV